MKSLKLALGLLLAGAAVTAPAEARRTTERYTSLTVFGDSLVDAGNIFASTGGLTPSASQGYFQGRFTNGYDYTDLLSISLFGTPTVASLRGGTNFAFGGARATGTSAVPDLNEQLAFYAAYLAGGGSVDGNGLFVLNFGGNDVFAAQGAGSPTGYASDEAFLRDAARTYAQGVQRLNDLGARNILLTGFPVASEPGLGFSLQAEGFLTSELAGLSLNQDTTLFRFSYLDFFGRLQANPSAFGLPQPLILPPATCRQAQATPNCTGYFSFDGTHPTAAIHVALFNDIDRQFNLTAAVPEPATWGMMILGFGAVGGAMRLKRRRVAAAA